MNKKTPAFTLAIFLLAGAGFGISLHFAFLLLLGALLYIVPNWKRKAAYLLAFIFACLYANTHLPPPLEQISPGKGIFAVENLSRASSPFQKCWQYKGKLKIFQTDDGKTFYNIPCRLNLPLQTKRPVAASHFLIHGALAKPPHTSFFVLKSQKNRSWIPIAHTFSLAEWRFLAKERVRSFLKKHLPHPESYALLASLFTGDVENRSLSLEFGKLGLQHLLAISGFHFSIFASFLSLLLRLFLPHRFAIFLLLLGVTAYFFFLGSSASIQRGWLAIVIFFGGQLLYRKTSALNALGAGVIAAFLFDPLIVSDLGFQLSYLATGAILLLYSPVENLLQKFSPKRTFVQALSFPLFDQHGYLFSSWLRQACALNVAVHLAAIPLLLFYFHKFPLFSLLYNLFFPFLANICFLLLLLGFLIYFICPPLGHLLFTANSFFTSYLLLFTSHPPAFLNFSIHSAPFPFWILILLFLGYGTVFRSRRS